MSVMPPDSRAYGQGNPPQDFNQLCDDVGLLLQFAALFSGPAGLPPAYPAGNAQNLATVQQLVASGALSLAQITSNSRALLLQGSVLGGIAPSLLVQDQYGQTLFEVGVIGCQSNGSGFFAYDRYGCPAVSIKATVNGLSGQPAGGVDTYAPAQSPLSGSTAPSGGVGTINWMGVQDDWSGADMEMYVPVTFSPTGGAAASVTVDIGACCILSAPLVSGTNYSSLSVLPIPGSIPTSQNMTIVGPNGTQVVTSNGTCGYDGSVIPVTTFNANANYPAFQSLGAGAGQTSFLIQGVFATDYPWAVQLISDSEPANSTTGRVRALRFRVPNKWYFTINATNCTLGTLQALSC
jgi:hypothetical protein